MDCHLEVSRNNTVWGTCCLVYSTGVLGCSSGRDEDVAGKCCILYEKKVSISNIDCPSTSFGTGFFSRQTLSNRIDFFLSLSLSLTLSSSSSSSRSSRALGPNQPAYCLLRNAPTNTVSVHQPLSLSFQVFFTQSDYSPDTVRLFIRN